MLGADEALVFFLTGDKESYVFALTREGFEWQTIRSAPRASSEKVAAFRRGLDVEELQKSIAGKPVLFDLGLAHELYARCSVPSRRWSRTSGISSSCRRARSPRCRSICW